LNKKKIDSIAVLKEVENSDNFKRLLSQTDMKDLYSEEITSQNYKRILKDCIKYATYKTQFCTRLSIYNHYNPLLILKVINNNLLFNIDKIDKLWFSFIDSYFSKRKAVIEDFKNDLIERVELNNEIADRFIKSFETKTKIFKDCSHIEIENTELFCNLKVSHLFLHKDEKRFPFKNGYKLISGFLKDSKTDNKDIEVFKEEEYLTSKEIAEIFNIPFKTFEKLRSNSDLNGMPRRGRRNIKHPLNEFKNWWKNYNS